MKKKQTDPTRLYMVAIIIALVALALGMWDVAVERDGGGNWLVQLAMPLLLILVVGGLYMRTKADRVANAGHEPTDGSDGGEA